MIETTKIKIENYQIKHFVSQISKTNEHHLVCEPYVYVCEEMNAIRLIDGKLIGNFWENHETKERRGKKKTESKKKRKKKWTYAWLFVALSRSCHFKTFIT